MQGGILRRTSGAWEGSKRAGGGFAALLTLLAVGACTHDGRPTGSVLRTGGGPTVAFESVDGPPPDIFQKLVATLAEEANTRRLSVVSRQATAPSYRVRTYLAVHIVRKQPRIGWVWDVYDAERRRALRIAGEEIGGRSGRDAWQSADAEVLRRIARKGMDRLAVFVGNPDQGAPGEPLPSPAEESDGTFVASVSSEGPSATATVTVPLPPRRPQHSASTETIQVWPVTLAAAPH
jgi:hypothetical protein